MVTVSYTTTEMSPVNEANCIEAKTYESVISMVAAPRPSDLINFSENNATGIDEKRTSDLKKQLGLGYQILIRDSTQWLQLGVTDSTTVKDMKSMIEGRIGAPKDQQVLFEGKNYQELEDGYVLADYDIEENSTVWMLSPLLKLQIMMPQVGVEVRLKVYSCKTIRYIKEMIHNAMGISLDKQNLIYNGRYLKNGGSLSDYGIHRNARLYVVFGDWENAMDKLNLKLVVDGGGENFELPVRPSSSVLEIKAMVESKVGLPISLQVVMNAEEKLKDWKLMADYNIKDGSTLRVVKCSSELEIYIKTSGAPNKVITVAVTSSNTIGEIMEMIPEELDKVLGEKVVGRPSIFFGETRLLEDKTLAHYNIASGTFLSLERAILINVTVPSGEFVVGFKPSDTIESVKSKVEDACGVPWQLQALAYLEEELDDSYTLEDYEIHLENLWVLRWWCGGESCSFFWPNYAGNMFRK